MIYYFHQLCLHQSICCFIEKIKYITILLNKCFKNNLAAANLKLSRNARPGQTGLHIAA